MTDLLVTIRQRLHGRKRVENGGRGGAPAHRLPRRESRPSLPASAVAVLGLEGMATVLDVRAVAETLDGLPLIDLDLVVLVGEWPPVLVTRREPVLAHLVGRAQPGARLRVKVDPDQFANLYIDWHWHATL